MTTLVTELRYRRLLRCVQRCVHHLDPLYHALTAVCGSSQLEFTIKEWKTGRCTNTKFSESIENKEV